jgi:hypothetical protein
MNAAQAQAFLHFWLDFSPTIAKYWIPDVLPAR